MDIKLNLLREIKRLAVFNLIKNNYKYHKKFNYLINQMPQKKSIKPYWIDSKELVINNIISKVLDTKKWYSKFYIIYNKSE